MSKKLQRTMSKKVAPAGGAAPAPDGGGVETVMRVLREGAVDDLNPLDRTVLEKGRGPAGYADFEDVGLVYPEANLARAMNYLTLTIFACIIITLATHPKVVLDNSFVPLMGYGNVCIFLDTIPARYVAAVGLQIFGYYCLRYAITDVDRTKAVWKHNVVHRKKQMSLRWYWLSIGTDYAFAASSIVFAGFVLQVAPFHGTQGAPAPDHGAHHHLLSASGPEMDSSWTMWVHTMTFFQWIWVTSILLMVNFSSSQSKTRGERVFFWTYIAFAFVFPLEVVVNYAAHDRTGDYLTPRGLNLFLDYGWLVLIAMLPARLPLGTALVRDPRGFRVRDVDPTQKGFREKEGEDGLVAISPLHALRLLVLVPYATLSFAASAAYGVARRAAALILPGTPLAGRGGAGAAPAAGDDDVEAVGSGAPRPGRLKFIGPYVGDIFGVLGLLANPGMGPGGFANRWEHGEVYAGGVGRPCIFLMDSKSVNACGFEGVDCRKPGHHHNVAALKWPGDQDVAKPNFMRSGPKGAAIRKFVRSQLPIDPDDPRFKAAMDVVARRVQTWADYPVEDLVHLDVVKEFRTTLMRLFVTHLFLGECLDVTFVDKNVFPFPQILPWLPHIPHGLMPAYWRMKRAKAAIHTFMRHSPRAADIAAGARAGGLTDEEAFEALLTASTFNAAGMGNSLVNLLLYLPHFAGRGAMLKDDALLTSFSHELLRNNGPPLAWDMGFGAPGSTVVTTSAGKTYDVKNGTLVYTNLSTCNRDEKLYEDPHTFRADRFVPSADPARAARDAASGAEPLPSLTFGCALGRLGDAEYLERSHTCVFATLAPLFLKGVTRILLEYEYALDHESDAVVRPLVRADAPQLSGAARKGGCPFAFDISPEHVRGGGDVALDLTPKVDRVRLQFFDRTKEPKLSD